MPITKHIVIASNKGGVGKSMLSVALGRFMAQKGIAFDLVDHDPQKTLVNAGRLGLIAPPVPIGAIKNKIAIHDTPPFDFKGKAQIIKDADVVLVPIKPYLQDMLSLQDFVGYLKKHGADKKAWIVLNEVRRPLTKTFHEMKDVFKKNYPGMKMAKTELSLLPSGLGSVLHKPLNERAAQQIEELASELGIL